MIQTDTLLGILETCEKATHNIIFAKADVTKLLDYRKSHNMALRLLLDRFGGKNE